MGRIKRASYSEKADAFAMDLVPISLGELAGIAIGIVLVAALVFSVKTSVEDISGFAGFLRRREAGEDVARPPSGGNHKAPGHRPRRNS